ncbi:cytoplasmic protein [Salix suchowensis]|nr:cytoplasmic protein [Salix suchowensis]
MYGTWRSGTVGKTEGTSKRLTQLNKLPGMIAWKLSNAGILGKHQVMHTEVAAYDIPYQSQDCLLEGSNEQTLSGGFLGRFEIRMFGDLVAVGNKSCVATPVQYHSVLMLEFPRSIPVLEILSITTSQQRPMSAPNDEEKEDLLLACRYGDLQDVQQFIAQFGAEILASIQDDNANTVLHMACANGHLEHPKINPTTWAALNAHLDIVQALVKYERGPGIDLIDIKNAAGRTPLGEQNSQAGMRGAWLVKMMNLDAGDGENKEGEDQRLGSGGYAAQDIEVEIQDADGKIARMTIGAIKVVSIHGAQKISSRR